MAYEYDFKDYLSQVPSYKRKDSAVLKDRAKVASNLIYDPQKAEQERQARWNEAQQINKMQQLKASEAGYNEALLFGNAQAKKAAAIRAVNSGAVGSSGLSDYLQNQIDTSTLAQRINAAAQLSQNRAAAINDYGVLERQSLDKIGEIERMRGDTSSALYNQYEDSQDSAENAWRSNALNVALGIGQGELNAADLNQRKTNEENRIAAQLYEATLPYNSMTQYQLASLDLDTAKAFGKKTGSKSSSSSGVKRVANDTYKGPLTQNGIYGLRDVATQYGTNVGYDEKTRNVTVGNRVYTPQTLASMGGYIDNGRWKLPASSINGMLRP